MMEPTQTVANFRAQSIRSWLCWFPIDRPHASMSPNRTTHSSARRPSSSPCPLVEIWPTYVCGGVVAVAAVVVVAVVAGDDAEQRDHHYACPQQQVRLAQRTCSWMMMEQTHCQHPYCRCAERSGTRPYDDSPAGPSVHRHCRLSHCYVHRSDSPRTPPSCVRGTSSCNASPTMTRTTSTGAGT